MYVYIYIYIYIYIYLFIYFFVACRYKYTCVRITYIRVRVESLSHARRDFAVVCVRACRETASVSVRVRAVAAAAEPSVSDGAGACVRGGERVCVSHLTTTRVVLATVRTSANERGRAEKRE